MPQRNRKEKKKEKIKFIKRKRRAGPNRLLINRTESFVLQIQSLFDELFLNLPF